MGFFDYNLFDNLFEFWRQTDKQLYSESKQHDYLNKTNNQHTTNTKCQIQTLIKLRKINMNR